MGLIMLAWMLNMYRNAKANIAIVVVSLLLLGGGTYLDRSQVPVHDAAYMRAMIPHHSMAITRSEKAQLRQLRVCDLARSISQSQREEILEMDWLIEDVRNNGPATTAEDAATRPVPSFDESAERVCDVGEEGPRRADSVVEHRVGHVVAGLGGADPIGEVVAFVPGVGEVVLLHVDVHRGAAGE